MKFCKDCRFADTAWWERLTGKFPSYLKCRHPKSAVLYALLQAYSEAVNGEKPSTGFSHCSTMRLKHEACGEDAKLFTGKP